MKRFIKSAIACVAAAAMIATVAPVTTYAASKSITVSTQKELNTAIKKGTYTKITIKTSKDIKITIPASKNAAKVAFTVNAPKAKIANKASVKSLIVANAKSFTEFGKGNTISITDADVAVTVAKASEGASIKVNKEGANVKIVANGAVDSVDVAKSDAKVVINGTSDDKINVTISKPNAKVSTSVPVALTANRKASVVIAKGADASTVTVATNAKVTVGVKAGATVGKVELTSADANVSLVAKGTVSNVTVAKEAEGASLNINASGKVESVTVDAKADVAVKGSTNEAVKVTVNAADTTVKAETKVETTLNANAKVDLAAGAEGSKVTTAADVKAEVTNGTTEKVTITDSTGKESTVEAGKSETTTENKPATGGSTGGSTGGGTYYPTKNDPEYIEISGKKYYAGEKITVVEGYEGSYADLLKLIQESQDKTVCDTVTYTKDSKEYKAVVTSKDDTKATLLYTGGKTNDYLMTITWDGYGYKITWEKGKKGTLYSKTFPKEILIKEGETYKSYGVGDKISVNGREGTYAQLLDLIQKSQNVKEKDTVKFEDYEATVESKDDSHATLTYVGKTNKYSVSIAWIDQALAYEINWSSVPRTDK